MTTAIAVISGKGGVGKTTTSINIGAALAESGRRVLLIDCDPQANLTSGVGFDPYAVETSIFDVLIGTADAASVVQHTASLNLDVLVATPDLVAVESRIDSGLGRERRLGEALDAEGFRDAYDFIFIDSPPSFGFHTVSAMAAADYVLIPVQMSGFAVRGLKEVLRMVHLARTELNPHLRILGIVPTFVNLRTKFSRQLLEGLCDLANIRVFETCVTPAVKLAETSLAGIPITDYAPTSRAAIAYRQLAEEVERVA